MIPWIYIQVLEQVINGGSSKGFRVRLIEKYQGCLAAHDHVEENITSEQLQSCAK